MSDTPQMLARVTAALYARGLITASGGNLSARDADLPYEIWITPAGMFKGDLRPEHMTRMGLDGKPCSSEGPAPSTEWRVHYAIYRSRPDVQAIVHTHAPQAFRLALTDMRLLPISLEAAQVGEIPVVPFLLPGTDALAEGVAASLGSGTAVFMQNHGLVVAAEGLERAAALTEIIEATAGALLTCRMLGVEPPVLSSDQVREVRARGVHGG